MILGRSIYRKRTTLELHGHIAMKVFVDLILCQFMVPDASLRKYIGYLADLHMEIQP